MRIVARAAHGHLQYVEPGNHVAAAPLSPEKLLQFLEGLDADAHVLARDLATDIREGKFND